MVLKNLKSINYKKSLIGLRNLPFPQLIFFKIMYTTAKFKDWISLVVLGNMMYSWNMHCTLKRYDILFWYQGTKRSVLLKEVINYHVWRLKDNEPFNIYNNEIYSSFEVTLIFINQDIPLSRLSWDNHLS